MAIKMMMMSIKIKVMFHHLTVALQERHHPHGGFTIIHIVHIINCTPSTHTEKHAAKDDI
jgi:hypothetical protein